MTANEMTSESAPKLPNITGETIAVLVGKQTFQVHEAVLTNSSEFFKAATKPEWRTDRTKPIDLSDQNPVPFARYVQWLYSNALNTYKSEHQDLEELARMYVVGEAVMDTKFQEVVLKTIIHLYSDKQRTMSLKMLRIIYEGTPPGSPARELMADICAFQLKPEFKRVTNLDIHKDAELMKDLIVALLKHREMPPAKRDRPWVEDPDQYSVVKAEGSITAEPPTKDKV